MSRSLATTSGPPLTKRGVRCTWIAFTFAIAGCSAAPDSLDVDADALPPFKLVEELRIGSADDPDTGFTAIGRVEVDRDGNAYVGESRQVQIRVYDPTGRLVRTIGRRGAGPGEFRFLPSFGVVGDTVWAFELGLRRLTVFDRRGTVLTTATVAGVPVDLHDAGAVGYVLPRYMREDGLLVGALMLQTTRPFTGAWPVSPSDTISVPRPLFTAAGAVTDTIGWDSILSRRPATTTGRIAVGAGQYRVPTAASVAGQSYSLHDGRVVVDFAAASGRQPVFTITRLGQTGDTTYHRRFRYRPKPFRRSTIDSVVWQSVRRPMSPIPDNAGLVRRLSTQPDSMAAFDAIRSALDFPDHQGPVQSLDVHGGEVWLRREDDGASPYRWMLLAADGNARGEVAVPRAYRVAWARGEIVWMIEPDENDVPWLVRYRLTPMG